MQNCNRYKNIWIECGPGVVTISVSWSAWHGSGSDHFTQIKLYQNIRTRSDLNHICGISSVHTFGHSTVFVTFHYQSMGRIINLLFFSEYSGRRRSCAVLVFIVICVILLLPGSAAETEGEHGGEELHGRHADNHGNHDVNLIVELFVDLLKTALVHPGVFGCGVSHTQGVHWLKLLLSCQLAACLRNLGTQKISTRL